MDADASAPDGSDGPPPDFSAWEEPDALFGDRPIRERLLDVVVGVRTPRTVAEIADRADCDSETARDYLQWFERMGLVTEQSGRPVRYESNRSYLRWRRIERLRRAYTDEELVARLERAVNELGEYRDRFDASRPEEVSLLAFADEGESAIEEIWEDLSAWKTARKRASLLDAARRDDMAVEDQSLRTDG